MMGKIKLGDIVYVDVMHAARKCRVISKRRFTYLLQTLGASGDTDDDELLIKRHRHEMWSISDEMLKHIRGVK